MKRKSSGRREQPEIPGMRRALADMVAEAIVVHTHGCAANVAAREMLARHGLSEIQFLCRWAAGEYDA